MLWQSKESSHYNSILLALTLVSLGMIIFSCMPRILRIFLRGESCTSLASSWLFSTSCRSTENCVISRSKYAKHSWFHWNREKELLHNKPFWCWWKQPPCFSPPLMVNMWGESHSYRTLSLFHKQSIYNGSAPRTKCCLSLNFTWIQASPSWGCSVPFIKILRRCDSPPLATNLQKRTLQRIMNYQQDVSQLHKL